MCSHSMVGTAVEQKPLGTNTTPARLVPTRLAYLSPLQKEACAGPASSRSAIPVIRTELAARAIPLTRSANSEMVYGWWSLRPFAILLI